MYTQTIRYTAYNILLWRFGYRAWLAQMVERPPSKRKVLGSIPGPVAFYHPHLLHLDVLVISKVSQNHSTSYSNVTCW